MVSGPEQGVQAGFKNDVKYGGNGQAIGLVWQEFNHHFTSSRNSAT